MIRLKTLLLLLTLLGCDSPDAPTTAPEDELRKALTFHASFNHGPDADFAAGDPSVYHAPSWSQRSQSAPGLLPDSLIRIAEGEGVHGDALLFTKASPSIVFYRADRNVAYQDSAWSGTLSFWLRLDPDEDLDPGYVDPIQISSKNWNDAALFVDFTRDDVPRHFRFAAFADLDVWNPEGLDWADIPVRGRPMVDLAEPPFEDSTWTHVVMTFEGFNTGDTISIVRTYLDGELQGTIEGREQTLTWEQGEAIIALGLDYVGFFDELTLFNRALEPEEVRTLYDFPSGVRTLLGEPSDSQRE